MLRVKMPVIETLLLEIYLIDSIRDSKQKLRTGKIKVFNPDKRHQHEIFRSATSTIL